MGFLQHPLWNVWKNSLLDSVVRVIRPPLEIIFVHTRELSLGDLSSGLEIDSSTSGQPCQVVAVGTVCPTPSLPANAYNAQVMVHHFLLLFDILF